MFHENYSDGDTCTISIKDPSNTKKRLFISSVYMPCNEMIAGTTITKLIEKTNSNEEGLIICSDTNSHNTKWGNKTNSKKGKELANIMNIENLYLENKTYSPTWSARGTSSTIDLTLTNLFAPKIENWVIIPGQSFSDHEYIYFDFSSLLTTTVKSRKLNTKKCDWPRFQEKLKDNLHCKQNLNKKSDIDFALKHLSGQMTSALEASCPTLSTKLKKPASRWTKSMVNRRERLIKIKQRALHNKLIPNKHKEILKLRRQYSKGKKELSKLIRKVKKENWHDYCSKIEKLKDTARLAKVSETNNTSLGALLKEDGSFTNSPLETIQHLSDGLLGPETNST